MFVVNEETNKIPIFVWLDKRESLEIECLEQAKNLSNLPFAYRHIALMPDTHLGYGMPVGGILATQDVVIPNAVGVDIACGMCFASTNIKASLLQDIKTASGNLVQAAIGNVLRNIPTGFAHHKDKQICLALMPDRTDDVKRFDSSAALLPELEAGVYQVGTLGGGNHFIELQEDSEGFLGVMLHSGSRNFGFKVCKHFNTIAKELNKKWHTSVPEKSDLAFLPVDTQEGQAYLAWMNIAMEFAFESRQHMMNAVLGILEKLIATHTKENFEVSEQINCHHNYAALENHFGKNVYVHRKGAICVRDGMKGIIPGAMGSYSYIVEGKGCNSSFHSASHGAGRNSSRKAAKEKYSIQSVIEDLKAQNVTLGKSNKEDVAEECRWAYKDIDFVIQQELDLVTTIKKLKTIGVVKG